MQARVERKTIEVHKIKRDADYLKHSISNKELILDKLKLEHEVGSNHSSRHSVGCWR